MGSWVYEDGLLPLGLISAKLAACRTVLPQR